MQCYLVGHFLNESLSNTLNIVMTAEGGDQCLDRLVSSPFARSDGIRVTHGSPVSCSLEVTDSALDESLVVEAHFGQSCDCCEFSVVRGKCCVYCACESAARLRDWSNSGDAFRHVISIAVPNCVVEVCEKCFYGCGSLRCITFGASSRLERICAKAFVGTSIESLSIPESVD